MTQIKITPLGGLKQIGSNMILLECQHHRALIDCGILFPNDDCFGIDYLIPDYRNLGPIEKVFITHGHEDHIGGIIHLIEHYPHITIYAPPFAAALIEAKMRIKNRSAKVVRYNNTSRMTFGQWEIIPIKVNHSIPDTYGLLIKDKQQAIFYLSDFKIDFNTPYEDPFDFTTLQQETSNCTQRILMADSTNILQQEHSPSEADIIPHLQKIIHEHNGRIFITLFASNIHRLQTIFNIASQEALPVFTYGRSIEHYIEIAQKEKLITPHNLHSDINTVHDLKKYIVLLTGCQGEFRGATRRIAVQENPYFTPQESDLFIFSSKTIPGNEKAVSTLLNSLATRNVKIITSKDELVHVTGHPGQKDLKLLINKFQPTNYIPIHGETFFLSRHIQFINQNFPQINTHFMLNFDQICITEKEISTQTAIQDDLPLLILGERIIIEREHISKRRKIATTGLINITINQNSKKYQVDFIGISDYLTLNFKINFEQIINHFLSSLTKTNRDSIAEQIRIECRREANKIVGQKPVVLVTII